MIPQSFPPAPTSVTRRPPDPVRLACGRGPEKTWDFDGLRIRDGHEITITASSRSSACHQQSLSEVEQDNPAGTI
ncbi:hypothetical protein [Streptomyces rimosus]|uniref:hypothetical protein n=1 Tax=Streptomyces rimosus TaxID=1927 RepID=UPI000AB6E9E6|nr:hypothetical protein [Streptomyces rimosus]